MAVLRRRMCTSNAVCYFQGTLDYDFDIFAARGESTAWVLLWISRSRPVGVIVCLVDLFNFSSTTFDPREWTMVVFWKEDSGRLRLITPENEGGDETSSPSPPGFIFIDDPGVPFGPSPPTGPPDPPGLPPGLPPAPPPAGGRGRARAENVSCQRSRPRSQFE